MTTPLDADRLEDLLEDILWAEASSKRSSAESLARLDRPQQEFVLHWVRALEKDNTACAYQLPTHAHRALSELALPDVEAWIIQGLDVYDQSGLYAAADVFKNVDRFLERARIARVGATLFLPATACRFESREDNFRFLKAAATYLWAQTRFGTGSGCARPSRPCAARTNGARGSPTGTRWTRPGLSAPHVRCG